MNVVLDLDAVRAFVHVADLQSFTRAADVLGTTQSAVSLKIKRLETQLERVLLERTPRSVKLSAAGHAFLDSARELLRANQHAVASLVTERRRLKIGLSEHVAGSALARVLAGLHHFDPQLVVEMHLGQSAVLLRAYEQRQFDAVIVRYEVVDSPAWAERADAQLLFEEPLVWLAARDWRAIPGAPLPVATLASPCAVRNVAIQSLERMQIAWQEVFVGGGIGAVCAAVAAGIAVSALARRVAPAGLVEYNGKNDWPALPLLPASQIVMHTRVRERRANAALRELIALLG